MTTRRLDFSTGVVAIQTGARRPAQNGRHEPMHRTLKAETAGGQPYRRSSAASRRP